MTLLKSRTLLVFLAAMTLGTSGCAGNLQQWIAQTRVHQGDVALDRGSLREAELEYRLALRVDPKNPRARAGFTQVAVQLAQTEYLHGDFDDALTKLGEAARYDAQNVRVAALRSQIDDARLKREIVSSNFPTYEAAGIQIQEAYKALAQQQKLVLRNLKRFGYTYDTTDLTNAIQQSYELQIDVAKNTNRLIAYRQLVESGVPAPKGEVAVPTTQSLLPLP